MSAQNLRLGLWAAVIGLALWFLAGLARQQPPPPTVPAPAPPPPAPAPAPPKPQPCPGPGPCPRPHDESNPVGASIGGPQNADGTQLQCDLPGDQHLKNCGGSDGAGLCVFTSISHSARWQNVDVLKDFRDWMRRHPGGGYPKKVDQMIAEICREKGVPKPNYVQAEGSDLEILKAACKSGRMPGVTYSFSPTGRYGGARISHMVSLPHADDHWFVVLDNNFPQTYEWMSPAEFRKTYTGGGGGWCVVLLAPSPPPPPHR
jgi:hypothetical protein